MPNIRRYQVVKTFVSPEGTYITRDNQYLLSQLSDEVLQERVKSGYVRTWVEFVADPDQLGGYELRPQPPAPEQQVDKVELPTAPTMSTASEPETTTFMQEGSTRPTDDASDVAGAEEPDEVEEAETPRPRAHNRRRGGKEK